MLEQLATFLSSSSLQKSPGRRAAVTVNAAIALLGTLKVAVGETSAEKGDIKSQMLERTLQEILRVSTSNASVLEPSTHSFSVFGDEPR